MHTTPSTSRGIALVTGGAGDIGREICRHLAMDGWSVVASDILPASTATPLLDAIAQQEESNIRYMVCDQTKPSEVAALFEELPDVSLVVIAAGTVKAQPFLEVERDQWDRQLEVNLTGSFMIAQEAAQTMVAHGTKGHLIFVSSWVASHAWPEITAYTVSKAGLDQLMRQIALELAPKGIRANSVAPGIVLAGLAKGQLETEPEYAKRVATAIPLGQLQTAADVAQSVGFLASPGASTMTGSILTVDGGCSLGQVR
ncbi:unannotated protein [freshwater metagenome]|jgi:NAD(P)-dependent dehydrogenase (short-subunit alcohol dehydrogenase family)|uniref:Unannotated protein n=1 Tax=freshwater metagenome TaxID=449393 RepID=A0A6J6DS23_9ZZZZ